MAKIKILYIITNLALGGAQKNALYMAEHLDSCKYEKHFISAPQGALFEDTGQYKQIKFYFLPYLKRQISPIHDFLAFLAIRRYIKKHKITIVHTHSSKAGIIGRWAAKAARVSMIFHTIHGWSFNDYLPGFLKGVYVFIEKLTAKITMCMIAVSKQDIKKGLAHKIGQPQQYKLIHYGIEINKFYKHSFQKKERKELIVGMIACLKPQKNPLDFIKVAEIISRDNKKVKFKIIGDGVLKRKLEKEIMIRGLSEQVDLLGWRRDIPELINQIDIVVLTSLWEGLPIALLEAMATAKPIVAYDTDGICEAVQHGLSGFICPKNDINSLADNIKKLLNDLILLENMGGQGYQLICDSDFNSGAMMQSIEGLYVDMSKNKKID